MLIPTSRLDKYIYKYKKKAYKISPKNLTVTVFSQIWAYIQLKLLLNCVPLAHRFANNFFFSVLTLLFLTESLRKLSIFAKLMTLSLVSYGYNLCLCAF